MCVVQDLLLANIGALDDLDVGGSDSSPEAASAALPPPSEPAPTTTAQHVTFSRDVMASADDECEALPLSADGKFVLLEVDQLTQPLPPLSAAEAGEDSPREEPESEA